MSFFEIKLKGSVEKVTGMKEVKEWCDIWWIVVRGKYGFKFVG